MLTSDRSVKIALTPVPELARNLCDDVPVSTGVLKGFVHCSGICVNILVDTAWLESLQLTDPPAKPAKVYTNKVYAPLCRPMETKLYPRI